MRWGNPWAGQSEAREPVRRLRGHLVLPVTVWLANRPGSAGEAERPAGPPLFGLTVSSVLLAEGRPAMLAGLITPSSELADLLQAPSALFVVHVLGAGHRRLAQHFAGEMPAPMEMLSYQPSPHGPRLDVVGDKLCGRATAVKPFGWSLLVEAEVERAEAAPAGRGLAWYRGAFRVVDDR